MESTSENLENSYRLLEEKYKEILSAEEKYRTLLELAPDAFFQGDSKGNFITVNDKTIELTGYSRDELLRMNMADLFPKNILLEKPLRYDLLKIGGTIKIERTLQRKDGETIYVEMNSKAMPDGSYQSLIRNITARKLAQEAIIKSETRLRRAELASKSGNWELHLDSKLIVASEGAVQLYGFDKSQFDYEFIKEVPLPEYRTLLDTALINLIEHEIPYDVEFKIKTINTGDIKDIHSIALFDKEKRIIFGIIQDITDQKRIQKELLAAKEKAQESDRLKTVFLQNMSHEIRTPMNAIMGFSDLLEENFDDKLMLKRFAKIIKQRSADLLDLINDILDLSQIETGKMPINTEDCNLTEVFNELHVFFVNHREKIGKHHIGLHYSTECNCDQLYVRTDILKLKQIFINLIYNAFKFTQSGSIQFGCKDEHNKLLFFVTDTGIGIPADKQDLIFNRFTQLNTKIASTQGGTGLGLSIVKGLVELLGGTIKLESVPGQGSTFTFSIEYQLASQLKENQLQADNKYKVNWEAYTALIVEDDVYSASYLEKVLDGTGIKVLIASSGEQAIELIESTPMIDIVLLDLRLGSLDGYETLAEIKKKKPDIKIIAQTAYASNNEHQHALLAGFDDYLSKPVKKELLISKMNEQLHSN